MSLESAKAFLQKVSQDKKFRDLVAAAPDAGARQAIIKQAGFDITKADLLAVANKTEGELTDADLEAVAGGTSVSQVLTVIGHIAVAVV